MKPDHSPADHPSPGREKSEGSGQLAAIACLVVLMLAAAPAEQAQGAGQTAKEGHAQSLPVVRQPATQGSSTPAAPAAPPTPSAPGGRLKWQQP